MISRAVAYRLLIASFSLAGLMVITAETVHSVSQSVEQSAHFIKGDAVPGTIAANAIRNSVMRSYEYAVDALAAATAADRDDYLQKMTGQDEKTQTALAVYRETMLINPVLDATNIKYLDSLLALYAKQQLQFAELVKAGQPTAAQRLLNERLAPAYHDLQNACDDVVQYNNDNAVRLATAISLDAARLRRTVFTTVGLAMICGVFIALNLWSRYQEEQEPRP